MTSGYSGYQEAVDDEYVTETAGYISRFGCTD
jgi:hypothetical protein